MIRLSLIPEVQQGVRNLVMASQLDDIHGWYPLPVELSKDVTLWGHPRLFIQWFMSWFAPSHYWKDDRILSTWPLGTQFSEIGNKMRWFSFQKMKVKNIFLQSHSHIFQYMGKIICVEFQRYHLKFHTKCLTLKDTIFIQSWIFKNSYI